MVRKGVSLLVACAGGWLGCAQVTLEDPPSNLGADTSGSPSGSGGSATSNNPMGTPVLPGNPTNPTQMERPLPLPVNPGAGGSGAAPTSSNGGTGSTMPPPTSSGPSGMELLFEDFDDGIADNWIADMEDGDDLVGSWSVVPVEMGSVYAQTDSSFEDDSWAVAGLPEWTDVELTARFRFTEVSDIEDATVMLAVRFASKQNYYYLEYRGDGTLKLVQELDGSESELADSGEDRVVALGQWITLRLVVRGTALTAFVDDGPEPAAAGTAYDLIPQGGIALGVKENAAVEFDDVRVAVP